MGYYTCSFSSLLSTIITITFFLLNQSSTSTGARRAAAYTGRFSKIYAFGDSYTDTGDTGSATGPSSFSHVSNFPYGITYFHRPTNRYSDGRLIVDFLANNLSLPFLQPYKKREADFSHGVNFAVAGSTAIDYDFFVKNNATLDVTPQSLQTQLIWLNKLLEGKGCQLQRSYQCRMAIKDALFWVGEIGANDYAYAFTSVIPSSTIQKLAIKNVAAFVQLQALLEKGAKYIVVEGLPMTGCLPLALFLAPADDRDSMGCVASANQQTKSHNALLQTKLEELRKRYPNAFISYADFWNAHLNVMNNPTSYGLTETLKACCGYGGGPYNFDAFSTCGSPAVPKACTEPVKFVNWDGVHLTEAMYKVVADKFFRRGYCRPSFNLLLEVKRREG